MRIRTAVAAAVGAFAIVATLPGSASAAEGVFHYRYQDVFGQVGYGALSHPPSGECIDLPEAGQGAPPADTPRNHTGSTAAVFTGLGCTGDFYVLRPNGGAASDRLKLRSVSFS